MPVRLGFSIAGCSGEDPEFPASELLYASADSRGWCTPRFSQYPQELTLRLDAPARLQQVQLLSHESKIAARVELLVGTFDGPAPTGGGGAAQGPAPAGADPGKATWRRLGFLTFDSNERSGFTARELKSVALADVPAHLVRLVFHRCHPNAQNIYSQVSLVALSLLGEPLAPAPLAPITNMPPAPVAMAPPSPFGLPPGMPFGLPPGQPALQTQPGMYMQAAAAPALAAMQAPPAPSSADAAAALAAELGVDAVTAQRIHELQLQKQQAIEREDYDEAKRLKGAVDRLRAVGGAIAGLEARKRAAVEEEDYDLAKQLKQEVDRMRNSAYTAALSGGAAEAAFSPTQSRRGSVAGAAAAPAAPSRQSGDGQLAGEPSGRGGAAADGGDYASPPQARRPAPPAASPSGTDWGSHDDRPAQAKGAYDFENANESSTPVNTRRRSVQAGPAPRAGAAAASASDAGPPPPGFPADLAPPEQLSAADGKDAAPLADLVGEYLARCLYSRTWQLREAALQRLAADLEGGRAEAVEAGGADAAKTLGRALARACRDKVAAVFAAALGALRALAAATGAGRLAPRDLQAALADLLPLLVEKAADLNQRTREAATETLVALAGAPEAGLRAATAAFLRAPKPGAAPKVVLGRLQLVSALLPVVGVAARGGDGFQPEALMDFACPALGHSSAEVRGAAVALVLLVAGAAGPGVARMLPADLNSKVREQIDAGLLNPTAALQAPPAKPAPAAAASKARAPPAAGKPAAAAAQPAAPQQQSAQPAAQQPPQQQPAASAGVASPAAAAPGGAEEDPAAYAAEVRAREARLGPAHPEVAEAICNLAILHNQRGDTGAALPLYERALAIWEAACGPDSPDVAHTLTDIAVIHLEQGRDDLGRPLLQRALRIQEAQLGPDHPDVQAIRDVLDEEG